MTPFTRAQLGEWQGEIAQELLDARAELATQQAAHKAAQAEDEIESARCRDLNATIALVGAVGPANALRERAREASRPRHSANVRTIAAAIDALELRVDDLRQAAAQIDALLAPPALAVVPTAPRAAGAAPREFFEPIVPARVT